MPFICPSSTKYVGSYTLYTILPSWKAFPFSLADSTESKLKERQKIWSGQRQCQMCKKLKRRKKKHKICWHPSSHYVIIRDYWIAILFTNYVVDGPIYFHKYVQLDFRSVENIQKLFDWLLRFLTGLLKEL